MKRVTFCLVFVLCVHLTWGQFDSGMSGDRSVIVQLLEWPFNDIKEECKNVLGPQGFGAVLVTPITENAVIRHELNGRIVRPWWERYQPVSWNILSRSGTEQEFHEMVEECNKNDVRVYVDVVFNHGAGGATGTVEGVGGTLANLTDKNYPGFGYDESNFHSTCPLNFLDSNRTAVRVCELAGLQDVNQTQPYVQKKIVTFLNKLLGFGVAGFRVDAAKHIWPSDLLQIYNELNNVSIKGGTINMRPYWTLEVFDDDGSYQDDYKTLGSEYDFNYFAKVAEAFKNGTLPLSTIYKYAEKPLYLSETVQVMNSNHDLQRWIWHDGFWDSVHPGRIQQMMDAFVLTFPRGVPNILSGFSYKDVNEGPPADEFHNIISPKNCSHGWTCEHRSKPLQRVMKYFTNFLKDEPIDEWWSDWNNGANQAAFTRGQKGFAVFNADAEKLHKTFNVSLPAGIYCDLATGFYCHHHQMCMGIGELKRKVEVKEDGSIEVSLPGMSRSGSLSLRHQFGDSQSAHEPAYLVISVHSMYPSAPAVQEPTRQLPIIGWITLSVAVVVAVLLVSWFLRKRLRSTEPPYVKS